MQTVEIPRREWQSYFDHLNKLIPGLIMTTAAIRTTQLPDGQVMPVLGMGTWHIGEDPRRRDEEITALKLGL